MIYLISALLGATGAWLISRYAVRLGLIDIPDQRSSHQSPTPKGGGIGLLVAFMVVSLVVERSLLFWLPASLLGLLSLSGDRCDISPALRLLGQFLAAGLFLFGAAGFSLPGSVLLLCSAVFIVGTANLYNFMDGINGISALTGIVAFALLAVFSLLKTGSPDPVVLALSFACAGFLPFNLPRARVFMGDVGSILLGFVFACSVFQFSQNLADFLCLISFLFLFYADTLTTLLLRFRAGEQLTRPHRRHLYQVLCNEGRFSHWKVSLGYSFAGLLIGLSMLVMRETGVLWQILLLLFWGLVYTLSAVRIRRYFHNGFIQEL